MHRFEVHDCLSASLFVHLLQYLTVRKWNKVNLVSRDNFDINEYSYTHIKEIEASGGGLYTHTNT